MMTPFSVTGLLRWLLFYLLFIPLPAHAQSDIIPKGSSGFEMGVGEIFLRGKNPRAVYIGTSADGQFDIGIGYTSFGKEKNAFAIASAFHIGGELQKPGLALALGYVITSDSDNYLAYGPSFYSSLDAGDVYLVPGIGFELATSKAVDFAGILSLAVCTKGRAGLVLRPSLIFAPENSAMGITAGFFSR